MRKNLVWMTYLRMLNYRGILIEFDNTIVNESYLRNKWKESGIKNKKI